jgi:hypothetical protein
VLANLVFNGPGFVCLQGKPQTNEEIRFIRDGFKDAQASFPAVAVQSPAA